MKQKFFSHETENFLLPGPVGDIEVLTTYPDQPPKAVIIIAHPHPLHGGTMHNKVVTQLYKTFNTLDFATLRFNFRGVEQSGGHFDQGIGETQDVLFLISWLKQVLPNLPIWLAGFSFGGYVCARAANETQIAQLITVAPAVNHGDFTILTSISCPWLIVHGDEDALIPIDQIQAFVSHPPVPIKLRIVAGASHFFHGRLLQLRDVVLEEFRELF